MRRVIRVLLVPVALLALLALAGCGSAVKNVIASVSASHSISLPTDQPTTAPPTPVASPTVQPTTPIPTTPVATTPVATTPAATTAAPSPTSTGSSTSTPAWLWLILALVVIAGLTFILIARAASKRSAVAGQWQSAVTDLYARGSALHDAMASVEWPSGPGASPAQAQARWVDIQSRADDLAQTLYRLRETAPDPDSRARVDDVLAALQSVRTAMDAERTSGGGAEQNEYSRSRLYEFARSLRALRSDESPGPGMP
jgi:hypothetical protein